jgi:hypothetical protein
VIAERLWVPELRLLPDSVTLVRGCLAAAAREMYRPVMALRLWPLAMVVSVLRSVRLPLQALLSSLSAPQLPAQAGPRNACSTEQLEP